MITSCLHTTKFGLVVVVYIQDCLIEHELIDSDSVVSYHRIFFTNLTLHVLLCTSTALSTITKPCVY